MKVRKFFTIYYSLREERLKPSVRSTIDLAMTEKEQQSFNGNQISLVIGSICLKVPSIGIDRRKPIAQRVDRKQELLSKIVTYSKDATFSHAFEGFYKSTSFRYISWIITEGVSDHQKGKTLNQDLNPSGNGGQLETHIDPQGIGQRQIADNPAKRPGVSILPNFPRDLQKGYRNADTEYLTLLVGL